MRPAQTSPIWRPIARAGSSIAIPPHRWRRNQPHPNQYFLKECDQDRRIDGQDADGRSVA